MKNIFTLIIICITSFRSFPQSYDTTNYYGKMNYVFHYVDKGLVNTGLLRDYGIEFLNFDNYTGAALHDSNYVALDEWRMLYTGLYSSQINSNANLLYLDTVNRLINKYIADTLPISFIGLHYNYEKLKDNAVTANLLSISNDRFYDVPGRPATPFEGKTLFAIAPVRQAAVTGSNEFIFRPELFMSNTGKTISELAYKKQGSSTYQIVTLNTPFTISYDSSGFYDIAIRIKYTDNSTWYGHTKVVVYETTGGVSARYGTTTTPATNEPVTATRAYLGQTAAGDITIDLAVDNTTGQIRKPLIVVEGFDATGEFGYRQLVNSLTFDDNSGSSFITLNDDLDDINEYDLIFVNFTNGTDYIQRNAFLLQAIIEEINTRKTTWGGVRQDS